MGRRPVSLVVRVAAVIVLTCATLACTSCGWPAKLRGETIISAERSLAIGLDYHFRRAEELVSSVESADQITTADLENVFGVVLLEETESSSVPPIAGSALYGFDIEGKQIALSVFLEARASQSGPGVTYNITRFGCVQLAGVLGSRSLTMEDTRCPGIFAEWGDDDSEDVSIEEMVEKYRDDIG